MSRKDYVAIALALHHHGAYSALYGSQDNARAIALDLCDVFMADNPSFDSSKFMAAVESGISAKSTIA